ncbi:protein of unknown function (plasmid) [Cupriavidus taiwanensis]|uniref:Uncharacterized protein n=1 Tax=Cupriavidus taiwanensis TaxID=164546 RepID=A0A375HE79_9BURK|nr:protein of unknown function [Cupriavidus taiwanensis]SPA11486.1 protein of unknown function [Cupriavidus taiwanensis]SPD49216.1 protein of unknown function [Cupriavidus taiwanensis]
MLEERQHNSFALSNFRRHDCLFDRLGAGTLFVTKPQCIEICDDKPPTICSCQCYEVAQ